MKRLLFLCIFGLGLLERAHGLSTIGLAFNSSDQSTKEISNGDEALVSASNEDDGEGEAMPNKPCRSRSSAPNFVDAGVPVVSPESSYVHHSRLCGNENKEDDRCLFSCVAGGFFHGDCGDHDECFCYRDNPEKGFIIERKQPILRRVKTKPGSPNMKSDQSENQKEITLVTDDYTTGYVDVDVNLNLEWDMSYVNEWFQSFNFYNNLKCDPCLCPAGCAIYGYFAGYCTPQPVSECMCATATRKPPKNKNSTGRKEPEGPKSSKRESSS